MEPIARIEDFADPTYNPFTAMKDLGGEGAVKDFYPELAVLREESPVFRGSLRQHFGLYPDLTTLDLPQYTLLGFDVVRAATANGPDWSNGVYAHNLGVFFGRSITVMDDPEHRRYRALFQKAFSPRMIAGWGEEIIPRMIGRLIDAFEGDGRAELITRFALHFPFHFIHEIMALPIEDRDIFHKLAFGQIVIGFDPEHGMEAVGKLKDYLTAVIAARRADPHPDDFVSMIATAEIDGERLPDDVCISFFRQLMNAGGDTSFNGFSTVMCALLTHPEQLAAVKADRSLVGKAIEEGLRWNAPVPAISRTPTRPVEIAGVTINPGDNVQVFLASANRDPQAFDRPDAFDISRATRSHGAFGYGAHMCIGQHLARMEMAEAMNMLFDRLPSLRLDPDYPPPEVSGFSLRGAPALHVRFD